MLDVQLNDNVLEVGFGPGVGIQILAGLASAGYVAGVDPSREMVEQARARNAKAIKGVGKRHGSVESLPFEDNTFDKVLAINSMQVWPDAVAGLREIRRVLKAGHRVALGFTPYSGQPKSGLADTLMAAGFTNAHIVKTGHPHPKTFLFERSALAHQAQRESQPETPRCCLNLSRRASLVMLQDICPLFFST